MASGTGTALMIAAVGLSALGGMRMGVVGAQADIVAVVAPPWQGRGMAWAAGFDLPIVDLLWSGRVVVFDLSGDPAALARLQGRGFLLLDAAAMTGCLGADSVWPIQRDRT